MRQISVGYTLLRTTAGTYNCVPVGFSQCAPAMASQYRHRYCFIKIFRRMAAADARQSESGSGWCMDNSVRRVKVRAKKKRPKPLYSPLILLFLFFIVVIRILSINPPPTLGIALYAR